MGIRTSLWEKWIEFRDAWLRITLSAVISPLLYLIAFGYGLGGHTGADGHPYIAFLIPGVIALSSMNTGYSAVATPLNVQRLYEHSFEQILISPTPLWQYILGETFGGALRGLYVAALVLLLSLPFGVEMHVSVLFFAVIFLNGATFAALGVLAAIMAKTHADVARFSTFVITPMTFLCNTFFSLEKLPAALKTAIGCLPLSCASSILRAVSYGEMWKLSEFLILLCYLGAFLAGTYVYTIKKKSL